MPIFAMIARDGPDGLSLRKKFHNEHVAHVSALNDAGRIVLAGPLKDDDNENSIGAVIVFEAADLEAARRIVDQDPYVTAGVFESLTVNAFRKAYP